MLRKLIIFFWIIILNSLSLAFAETETLPILSGVGGNFSAINDDGEAIEFSDYAGKVVVLAFGYTNCADICPFTLGYLKRLYKELSEDEQKHINVIFVTVDPKYDTPDHLKEFINHFNAEFIGLSGSKEQIDYIVSLYQAHYNKLSTGDVPTQEIRRINPKKVEDAEEEKSSLFSHTVTIYLIDKEGYTRSLEFTGTPVEEFADKIRQLINE